VLDFRLLYHLARVYASVRYDAEAQIRAGWAGYYERLEVVELRRTRNRYLLGTLPGGKEQEIVIRGTVNLKNSLYDLRIHRRRNDRLGIRLHSGFQAMAEALYQDLRPRLDRGCRLTLMGHSLGAAEALILGLLLEHDGFRVRVFASGPPRVTDAAGAQRYARFPVLRILNAEDPVPLLPAHRYRHLGPALVLLDGPFFCYLPADFPEGGPGPELLANARQGERFPEQLREHLILDYLIRLEPKITGAVQVPFAERYRYLDGRREQERP